MDLAQRFLKGVRDSVGTDVSGCVGVCNKRGMVFGPEGRTAGAARAAASRHCQKVLFMRTRCTVHGVQCTH